MNFRHRHSLKSNGAVTKKKQGNNDVGFISDYVDPLMIKLLNRLCDSHYVI